MIIQGVLVFGLLSMIVEFILICGLPPRLRLRMIGSSSMVFHILAFGFNLAVHWGTLVGTGSAFIAFIGSFLTLYCLKLTFGGIYSSPEGLRYRRGIIRYDAQELT